MPPARIAEIFLQFGWGLFEKPFLCGHSAGAYGSLTSYPEIHVEEKESILSN